VDELKYKKMWEELKRRVEQLREYNRARKEGCIKEGEYALACTYSDWAIEDTAILGIMKKLEEEVD